MRRKHSNFTEESRLQPGPEQMGVLLQSCGIRLSRPQLELLWEYHQLLRQYNPELNLTRIHNFDNMVLKLYADSILPGRLMELPSPLLDLGTGPGMPGIPLRIAYPHLEILLAESRHKRVAFLETVLKRLQLKGIRVEGKGITPLFQEPVSGVITRAVERMDATLDRVRGCLATGGLVIFMKGPRCDEEIREAQSGRFSDRYRLVRDESYHIPNTAHERRLVVFERQDKPLWAMKAEVMKRHTTRQIESEQNEIFRNLKKLLGSRGIKKQGRAIVSGTKQVRETMRDFPDLCEAWISSGDMSPPPSDAPPQLAWYQLSPALFDSLDAFGTHTPLLLIRIPPIEPWSPTAAELPPGCTLLIPFQDPENVGAVIRSAAAFGVKQVVLLSESAHPFHPKALRVSGGAALRVRLLQGPALETLPDTLPIIPLSSEGKSIASFTFPGSFGLLTGMEGSGLPNRWRERAVAIPMEPGVESLNAATATAIALYAWLQSAGEKK